MLARIKAEPALVSVLVQAIIGLVIAFGVTVTSEQAAAIMTVTAALLGLFVRSQATPTAKG